MIVIEGSAMAERSVLLELPSELHHYIAAKCDAASLLALSSVCRILHVRFVQAAPVLPLSPSWTMLVFLGSRSQCPV